VEIDWLTIAAQIVNFLVLIWLLQRFLYKPITNAMARREQRIEQRLSDARKAREEAELEARTLRDKQQELEDSKDVLQQQARKDADNLHKLLEAGVRDEISRKRSAWLAHLEDEHDETLQLLEKKMARQVVDTVRRILADFADTELSGQVASEFVLRIEALGADDRARLAEAAKNNREKALIESGLELPAPMRGRITRALHECLEQDIDVHYQIDRSLLLGVRLTLGGQQVEWSASQHLEKLGDLLREVLESRREEIAGQ